MRVLIICRKKENAEFNTIVATQAMSLQGQGLDCTLWGINQGGLWGYFKAIPQLNRFIRANQFDVFHAHYALSGFVASLANAQPLVVSLMGSDIQHNIMLRMIAKFFSKIFWQSTIVKSEQMNRRFRVAGIQVIPNGVNLETFYQISKPQCQQKLGWDLTKKHLLFAANPSRREKNFELTKQAFSMLKNDNVELHYLDNVKPEDMPTWLNASDVVLLSSNWEGSPNVIKEAMACSRPIVSTNVGDVKWLFGKESGHFISTSCASDFAEKIKLALDFSLSNECTSGRNRILQLGLDDVNVSKKLVNLYEGVIRKYA